MTKNKIARLFAFRHCWGSDNPLGARLVLPRETIIAAPESTDALAQLEDLIDKLNMPVRDLDSGREAGAPVILYLHPLKSMFYHGARGSCLGDAGASARPHCRKRVESEDQDSLSWLLAGLALFHFRAARSGAYNPGPKKVFGSMWRTRLHF